MRQKIHGVQDHPEYETLKTYDGEIDEGTYRVRLDYHAWGKSTNLFCYFTDLDMNNHFRLSVFHRSAYRPYKDGPAFDEVPVGEAFNIEVSISKNGLPKFMSAEKID